MAFTDEISASKEVTLLLEADFLGQKGISPIPFALLPSLSYTSPLAAKDSLEPVGQVAAGVSREPVMEEGGELRAAPPGLGCGISLHLPEAV